MKMNICSIVTWKPLGWDGVHKRFVPIIKRIIIWNNNDRTLYNYMIKYNTVAPEQAALLWIAPIRTHQYGTKHSPVPVRINAGISGSWIKEWFNKNNTYNTHAKHMGWLDYWYKLHNNKAGRPSLYYCSVLSR